MKISDMVHNKIKKILNMSCNDLYPTYPFLCTHLLPFVLGQVGLELEVGLELAGAELALVGAVYHDYLFGLSLALLVLVGLHLHLRMPVLHGLPSAALRISLSLSRTLLQLPWSFCNQASDLLKKAGAEAVRTFTIRISIFPLKLGQKYQ